MSWTFLALTMNLMMGGIIAYYGDLIGRKFGKKRISLFKMRPKYTAVLITSMTGTAIAFLTTGILFLLVRPIREIILDGEAAIASKARISREKDVLTQNLNVVQAQNTRAEAVLNSKIKDLADSDKKLAATEAKLIPAQAKLKTAEAKVIQEQHKIIATEAKLRTLNTVNEAMKQHNAQLAELNTDLTNANLGLGNKNRDLAAESKKLTTRNVTIAKENDDLSKNNEDISRRNLDLTRESVQLNKIKDVYERTNRILIDQNTDEIEKVRTLAKTKLDLTEANSKLTEDNKQLADFIRELAPGYATVKDAYFATRNRRIAIHKDEDLARVVVPANSSPEKVREVINQLMHDASQEALKKGALPGDSARAVQVVDRQFQQQNANGKVTNFDVSGSDRVDAVVSRLSWQTTPMGVMAIAVSNSVEQEPGAIDFQPFPNRMVYTKGHVVHEKTINSGSSSEKIFEELVAFLHETGQTALQDGVIPHLDPVSGEPQIGSLPSSEVVRLMEKVKSMNGRVKIKAITRQDLYSADQLNVDFVVGS